MHSKKQVLQAIMETRFPGLTYPTMHRGTLQWHTLLTQGYDAGRHHTLTLIRDAKHRPLTLIWHIYTGTTSAPPDMPVWSSIKEAGRIDCHNNEADLLTFLSRLPEEVLTLMSRPHLLSTWRSALEHAVAHDLWPMESFWEIIWPWIRRDAPLTTGTVIDTLWRRCPETLSISRATRVLALLDAFLREEHPVAGRRDGLTHELGELFMHTAQRCLERLWVHHPDVLRAYRGGVLSMDRTWQGPCIPGWTLDNDRQVISRPEVALRYALPGITCVRGPLCVLWQSLARTCARERRRFPRAGQELLDRLLHLPESTIELQIDPRITPGSDGVVRLTLKSPPHTWSGITWTCHLPGFDQAREQGLTPRQLLDLRCTSSHLEHTCQEDDLFWFSLEACTP